VLTRSSWWIVVGSGCALMVGNGPVMQFTFGVFLKPLMEEFGSARGTTSFALTVGLTATAFMLPVAGRLADRFGPRAVGLWAVSLMSLGLFAISLFAHSIATFAVLFALVGIAATGQTPLVYTQAVAACFDRRRGIALALTLTGVGIGSIVLPLVAQALIAGYGWRGGYLGIAMLLLAVASPSLLFLIPRKISASETTATQAGPEGLLPAQAARTPSFWLLLVGLFLGASAANGTIAHLVPMLTDRGMPAGEAAGVLAWVGAAAICGRLMGGVLLDRFWAPLVALIFLCGMAVGIGLLLETSSHGMANLAVVLIGIGLGVEADLVGFLLSRYLGIRAYGVLFGWAFGTFMLASSLGPVLMGVMFDRTGSYRACLLIYIAFSLVAATAFLSMGRYRYPVTASKERT
jgi:MFS family permease